jgi:hypothetical protein
MAVSIPPVRGSGGFIVCVPPSRVFHNGLHLDASDFRLPTSELVKRSSFGFDRAASPIGFAKARVVDGCRIFQKIEKALLQQLRSSKNPDNDPRSRA